MTRNEAALKLFAHGPLSVREFIPITRWDEKIAYNLLSELASSGELDRPKRGMYQLAGQPMFKTQVLVTITHRAPLPDNVTDILAARAYQWLHAKGGQGDAEAKIVNLLELPVVEMGA